MIIWFFNLGIVFSPFAGSVITRGPITADAPYTLWFTQKLGPIYWANTKPPRWIGWTLVG